MDGCGGVCGAPFPTCAFPPQEALHLFFDPWAEDVVPVNEPTGPQALAPVLAATAILLRRPCSYWHPTFGFLHTIPIIKFLLPLGSSGPSPHIKNRNSPTAAHLHTALLSCALQPATAFFMVNFGIQRHRQATAFRRILGSYPLPDYFLCVVCQLSGPAPGYSLATLAPCLYLVMVRRRWVGGIDTDYQLP